jgi:hypothetical protein
MMSGFSQPQTCPKCGGRMQEGITEINKEIPRHELDVDYPAYGASVVLGGSPAWWAIKAPERPGIADRVLTGKYMQVLTYRCEQCGFLESYAPFG